MKKVCNLIKRNILIFFRDRAAVFFSVLSMLIVLGVMVIFLGNMSSESIIDMLSQMGGERDAMTDQKNAEYLIKMWTLAGILAVNSLTISMTVMQNMISDEAQNRLASFYVAPVKRIQLALGYVGSSFLIASGMCVLTLFVGECYMVISGHPLLAITDILKLIAMIMLNAFIYASISYLLAMFIHSESAWGGILTVVGTLVGFVGAIYLPMSALPDNVAGILKCLPVLHGASMMRVVCTKDAVAETFAGLPGEVTKAFNEGMGVTVSIGGEIVTLQMQVAFLLTCGIIAIIAAALISKRRKVRDR